MIEFDLDQLDLYDDNELNFDERLVFGHGYTSRVLLKVVDLS